MSASNHQILSKLAYINNLLFFLPLFCYTIAMDSDGRKFHAQAGQAREEGNTTEALHHSDSALLAYDTDKDSLGFAEALADRSITLRNHSLDQSSKRIMILAKHEAMAAIEIAQDAGDLTAIALPIYNYAKVQEDLGEVANAIASYKEAISHMELTPPAMHNQKAILLDMKIRLSIAEIKNGNAVAEQEIESLIDQLLTDESLDEFTKDVWVSGAYMRLAEVHKDDQEVFNQYLSKSQHIAKNNPRLIVRQKQLENLFRNSGI
jgi:tetratricopeptide (TPR) repeat protein